MCVCVHVCVCVSVCLCVCVCMCVCVYMCVCGIQNSGHKQTTFPCSHSIPCDMDTRKEMTLYPSFLSWCCLMRIHIRYRICTFSTASATPVVEGPGGQTNKYAILLTTRVPLKYFCAAQVNHTGLETVDSVSTVHCSYYSAHLYTLYGYHYPCTPSYVACFT